MRHAGRQSDHGHPTAAPIPLATWRRHMIDADDFISAQLLVGHHGIEAAIRWLAKELKVAGASESSRPDPHRPATGYNLALSRAGRNGVVATDLLARAIAGHLIDDRGDHPRPWVLSDEHHRAQFAKFFLSPVPTCLLTWSKRRKREPQVVGRAWMGTLVREYTFRRVQAALGVLCTRAADAINQQNLSNSRPKD